MLKARAIAQGPLQLTVGGNGESHPKLRDAVRVGLCGIGRAGFNMVRRDLAALPQIKVAAGFDILPERGEQLAELCGSRICGSFEELLADDELELIIVATRSHEHVPMAMGALKAGRDVLVEKPMA